MADPARAAELAQRIKVVVAEALGRRVKDPRLEGVTVTDARVTNDLQHATVYYTVFGDEAAQADAAKGLEKAKGVLRQEVGRNITVRLTPTLEFVADQIPVVASTLRNCCAKPRSATPRWQPSRPAPSTPATPIRTRATSPRTSNSTKTTSTRTALTRKDYSPQRRPRLRRGQQQVAPSTCSAGRTRRRARPFPLRAVAPVGTLDPDAQPGSGRPMES